MTAHAPARTFYVNGQFVPEDDAVISVLDRGFLFADGVYEVSTVLNGKLVDNDAHLVRLQRSLDEISLPSPLPISEIPELQRKLIELNQLREGILYLQITRGCADRDFGFPKSATPTFVMFTQSKTLLTSEAAERGIRVITVEDLRWKRRDIKTVGLLAPVLAKQEAVARGANDAWLFEDGFVTEGSSNNAFIVTDDNKIVTRNLGDEILHGITRKAVLAIAAEIGLVVEERPFTIEEAKNAVEAFITSASTFVTPVVQIDDTPIGSGVAGPIAGKLRAKYIEFALATAV